MGLCKIEIERQKKKKNSHVVQPLHLEILENHIININIYIYISKDLMWESMRFCHIAHSMKRIEILLSHIRIKNKFKNRDSWFPLVQCFKTIFCYIFLFNVLKLLYVYFSLMFQDFSFLSHIKNSLHFHSPF